MAKSEAVKLKELEIQQQIITELSSLIKTEIGQAIAGVMIASLLDRMNLISTSGRFALETASIAFPAIKATAPLIMQGLKTGGEIAGKVAPALLMA